MNITLKEQFVNETFNNLRETISNFDKEITDEIYVISFWKSNINDDLRQPTVIIGFNTLTNFKDNIDQASDEHEAKWNFAFWLQNEELIIGDNDSTCEAWIKQLEFYYTDEEENFDRILELGSKIEEKFMDIIIQLSQKLHSDGIILNKFGKEIPIIIHELEYYDLPLSWTKQGNPEGITAEFEHWVNEGR